MAQQTGMELHAEATVEPMRLCLSWPPSVNNYWRLQTGVRGKRVIKVVSQAGHAYRRHVAEQVLVQLRNRGFGDRRLAMVVMCYSPDRRKRDLDNLCKSLQDAMTEARVYDDDSQIDDLRLIRARERSDIGGHVIVTLSEMTE